MGVSQLSDRHEQLERGELYARVAMLTEKPLYRKVLEIGRYTARKIPLQTQYMGFSPSPLPQSSRLAHTFRSVSSIFFIHFILSHHS